MSRLYIRLKNSAGRVEGLGDNEIISAELLRGNHCAGLIDFTLDDDIGAVIDFTDQAGNTTRLHKEGTKQSE